MVVAFSGILRRRLVTIGRRGWWVVQRAAAGELALADVLSGECRQRRMCKRDVSILHCCLTAAPSPSCWQSSPACSVRQRPQSECQAQGHLRACPWSQSVARISRSKFDRPTCIFFLAGPERPPHSTARNGLAQPVLAAAPVQLMHTTSHPPESESGSG